MEREASLPTLARGEFVRVLEVAGRYGPQEGFIAKFLYADTDNGGPYVCVRELDYRSREMGVRFVKPERVTSLASESDSRTMTAAERRARSTENERKRYQEHRSEILATRRSKRLEDKVDQCTGVPVTDAENMRETKDFQGGFMASPSPQSRRIGGRPRKTDAEKRRVKVNRQAERRSEQRNRGAA